MTASCNRRRIPDPYAFERSASAEAVELRPEQGAIVVPVGKVDRVRGREQGG